jgi:alpha-galactosidase
LGHEEQDAQLYASWGIDYLKYDLCSFISEVMEKQAPNDMAAQMRLMQAAYAKMDKALKATGRPIVFSLCQYGWDAPWEWAPSVGGNLWRTTGDVSPDWDRIAVIGFGQAGLESYSGPGHWNDPDMLEVGNGGMNNTEYRSHFSLWCIMAAPLIAGNDIANMKPETHDILTNKEVIAVDQDVLGKQGKRIRHENDQDVFVKPLDGGGVAVLLLNRGAAQQTISVTWEQLGLAADKSLNGRDLWEHKDLGKLTKQFSAPVASHGVVMITLKP